MIDFGPLLRIISENKSFLLTTHVNPDADAIGSEMGFAIALKRAGKDVHIVNYSETPYYLKFMDPDGLIQKYNAAEHDRLFQQVDVIAALDFNNSTRVVKMRGAFINSGKLKICIDHHQNPENFVDHLFIDTQYSSTGEIIFDFLKQSALAKIDKDIAEPLYAAIMTDTGSFRFDRTTPKLHKIIAELLEAGVNPNYVYDQIYDQSNFGKIKLLGEALSSLQISAGGKIAYMSIYKGSLVRNGADEADVDGFVNYCLSIKGVQVGVLFFELKDGFKVSFRSKGSIPVNKLAQEFGGGGHTNASGARLFDVSMPEYIPLMLKAAEKYLE
ncbi:MAG TPA: bifunctional oligoribonuclease/PAP phosphatase NrnA [Ignavibacteriales bacterium]|nr:bifunctional oligoribonuclease/PAP phosphatase NrnA [Ignavibacteriales bacterium]